MHFAQLIEEWTFYFTKVLPLSILFVLGLAFAVSVRMYGWGGIHWAVVLGTLFIVLAAWGFVLFLDWIEP